MPAFQKVKMGRHFNLFAGAHSQLMLNYTLNLHSTKFESVLCYEENQIHRRAWQESAS
jgi:hypothetical protein